jgi:hypothetical protein
MERSRAVSKSDRRVSKTCPNPWSTPLPSAHLQSSSSGVTTTALASNKNPTPARNAPALRPLEALEQVLTAAAAANCNSTTRDDQRVAAGGVADAVTTLFVAERELADAQVSLLFDWKYCHFKND